MPLVVTSPQTGTGVYGILQQPPSQVTAAGNQTAVCVGQWPWGPTNTLTYPGGAPGGSYLATFAPNGSVRTTGGHLAVMRKAWPNLGIIRALPTTAVKATGNLQTSGSVTVMSLTAAYYGTTGNSLVATVSAASDGNANHYNLTVVLSGASGTTTEVYQNLNVSGTGANVLPNLANSTLLSAATYVANGIPANGATTLSGGTSPAVVATNYVGTPGGSDYGFALCEQDTSISHLFTDDCGGSLRAAVGSGLLAHVTLTTNKIGYWSGNSGQSASSAQTDVASFRSTNICYVDPWAYVYDDTTGALQLAPGSSWAASVASQLPPSVDIGFRSPQVVAMLNGIAQLEVQRGPSVRAQNTLSGISTLTGLAAATGGQLGGYSFEGGFNSSGVSGETDLTWTEMGIFLLKSVTQSWQPYVNAPNITYYQQDLINSLTAFLATLQQNATTNPAFFPYINGYRILAPGSVNTAASIAGGAYTVAAQVKYGSHMRQIYFQLQGGAGITLTQN